MKSHFTIDAGRDIRLIPYSPVRECDTLEIRCQVWNDGQDDDVDLNFYIDGEKIQTYTIHVESKSYGCASCFVPMTGKVGKHIVSVNGQECPLTVVKDKPAVLDGGFIMFGPPNNRMMLKHITPQLKSFTEEKWEEYMDALAGFGQESIIIMATHQYLNLTYTENGWKAEDEKSLVAHYPSKLYPKSDIVADDPIAAILRGAERNDQKVFIAVGNGYGHRGTKAELCELYERYSKYSSFYGWYFACELNLSRTTTVEKFGEFKELATLARELAPVMPILMSPMAIPCREVLDYLDNNYVYDIVMPQDWVGQKAHTLEQSKELHRLLEESCRRTNRHLWANCEAFNFSEDNTVDSEINLLVPRFKDGGMDGEAGFIQQMQTVRPYVEKIMNFMFTGFFAPTDFEPRLGGERAVKQYEDYVAYAKAQENAKA